MKKLAAILSVLGMVVLGGACVSEVDDGDEAAVQQDDATATAAQDDATGSASQDLICRKVCRVRHGRRVCHTVCRHR
jgi:hypothetical protein